MMRMRIVGYVLCFFAAIYAREDAASFLDSCDITELKVVPIFRNGVKLWILLDLAREIPEIDTIQQEVWHVVLALSKEVQVFIESDYVLSEQNEAAIQAFLEHLYTLYMQICENDRSDYAIAIEKVLAHAVYQFHEMSVPN